MVIDVILRVLTFLSLGVVTACTSVTTAPIAPETTSTVQAQKPAALAQSDPGYVAIKNGKYKLTRDMTFQTKRFGTVVLTKGFESDGSSSPIADTHETRIAGFLHDSLYSVSGHLKLKDKFRENWTRKEADDEYCEFMVRLNVAPLHQVTNCEGVRRLPGIEQAWNRLGKKRKKRWKKRVRKHRKRLARGG